MPKDHRSEREWSVYILRCADRSLYTGVTTDVLRRVRQHNAGTRVAVHAVPLAGATGVPRVIS